MKKVKISLAAVAFLLAITGTVFANQSTSDQPEPCENVPPCGALNGQCCIDQDGNTYAFPVQD